MENNIEITARNLDSGITESFFGFADHELTLKIHHYEDEWEHFEAPPDIIILISAASWDIIFKPMVYDLLKTKVLEMWNLWVRSKTGTKNAISFNAEIENNTIVNFNFSANGSEEFMSKSFTEALNTVKEMIMINKGSNTVDNESKTVTPIYNDNSEKWELLEHQQEYMEDSNTDIDNFG